MTGSEQILVRKADGIHMLRNRVAHLEPLLRSGVVHQEFTDMRWGARRDQPDP